VKRNDCDTDPEANAGEPVDDDLEDCPICGDPMRQGDTTCQACGHDFIADAEVN
jgi:hypothetical protein